MPLLPLSFDPKLAVDTLCRADRRLAKVIEQAGPFSLRPERMRTPFEALARAIVYQQLSGKAAATIHGRLEALLGGKGGLRPEAVQATSVAAMRGAGMSRAKVAAIMDLAAKALEGQVPTLSQLKKMADDEILRRLVAVRGIGPWTVEMLLIFRLGRPDVLPVGDLGVRKGFQLTYKKPEMPSAEELARHAERWRPYRSVASWYMWRAVDLEKAKNGKAG